jgi:hypothetical protein
MAKSAAIGPSAAACDHTPAMGILLLATVAHNGLVGGSSPTGPTTQSFDLAVSETLQERAAFTAFYDARLAEFGLSGRGRADLRARSLAAKIPFLAQDPMHRESRRRLGRQAQTR